MADDVKKDFTDRQYVDFTTMAGRLPFTSEGKSVFYAGDNRKNFKRASEHAKQKGMRPISTSNGGAFLNQIDTYKTFGGKRNDALWDKASRKYASEATGNVKTFVNGANERSTFRRVELPTLLNNSKIDKINGVDRAKLREFKHKTYDRLRAQGMDKRAAAEQAQNATHRKVAVAEVRQDLNKSRQDISQGRKMLASKDNQSTARTKISDGITAGEDAKARMAATRKQHSLERAQGKEKQLSLKEQQRKDFSQQRAEKMKQLKEKSLEARLSGDRAKIAATRRNVSAEVKALRIENQKHVRGKIEDTKQKGQNDEKLKALSASPAQDKSSKTPQAKSGEQVKSGDLRTSYAASSKKSETASLVKDSAVKTISGYPLERFDKIHDRAYSAAIKRGASKENAQLAAQDRTSHVMEKVGLMQERAQLKQSPVEKNIKSHFQKDGQFRDKRISDLQAQAQRENSAYKGPKLKTPELRSVEAKIGTREFHTRANLDINAKRQSWSSSEYQSQSSSKESKLSEMRERDMSSYFASTQSASKSSASSSEGKSYYSGKSNSSSPSSQFNSSNQGASAGQTRSLSHG